MNWTLPRTEPNEKFHSAVFDPKGNPFAVIEVFIRENLPQERYWHGHTRFVIRSFEQDR